MRFQIHARRFNGDGRIRCARCNYTIVLPLDASVLMWDNGKKVKITDPSTNLVVHSCDRKMKWHCPTCQQDSEPAYRRVGKKTKLSTTCTMCKLGTLIQVADNDDQ